MCVFCWLIRHDQFRQPLLRQQHHFHEQLPPPWISFLVWGRFHQRQQLQQRRLLHQQLFALRLLEQLLCYWREKERTKKTNKNEYNDTKCGPFSTKKKREKENSANCIFLWEWKFFFFESRKSRKTIRLNVNDNILFVVVAAAVIIISEIYNGIYSYLLILFYVFLNIDIGNRIQTHRNKHDNGDCTHKCLEMKSDEQKMRDREKMEKTKRLYVISVCVSLLRRIRCASHEIQNSKES